MTFLPCLLPSSAPVLKRMFTILQMHLAVSRRIEINTKLDQDDMEGVDDREWVSLSFFCVRFLYEK